MGPSNSSTRSNAGRSSARAAARSALLPNMPGGKAGGGQDHEIEVDVVARVRQAVLKDRGGQQQVAGVEQHRGPHRGNWSPQQAAPRTTARSPRSRTAAGCRRLDQDPLT